MQGMPPGTYEAPFVDKRTEGLEREARLHLSSCPCQPGCCCWRGSPPRRGLVSSWAHFTPTSKNPKKGLPWEGQAQLSGHHRLGFPFTGWRGPLPLEFAVC